MIEPIVVRVAAAAAGGERPHLELWGVVTDDPRRAVRTVIGRVRTGRIVEATGAVLPAETVARLGLVEGQAWPL